MFSQSRYHDGRIFVIANQFTDQRMRDIFSLEDTDAALSSVQSFIGFAQVAEQTFQFNIATKLVCQAISEIG